MNQQALQRLRLEADLQRGFRDGEFVLHFQPRVATETHEVVALEALLRWQSPTRGLVTPDAFIGVLEEIGMMPAVGEWVLRSACARIARRRRDGLDPLRISINVSPMQFRAAGFAATVERVLRQTGVAPDGVELELSESGLIHDVDAAARTIGVLRELGIRILIDHFGTGYSSLAYLRSFAVDGLKIDRSFVAEIAHSARDRAVARALCELARSLDISVIAEGIENDTQARFFAGLHCAELQGYLFARPTPIEAIEQQLRPGAAPMADPLQAASRVLARVGLQAAGDGPARREAAEAQGTP
jgi:EAL domain-containing protein (putative c-di-GMP-specific phosphodiesterase class I)